MASSGQTPSTQTDALVERLFAASIDTLERFEEEQAHAGRRPRAQLRPMAL